MRRFLLTAMFAAATVGPTAAQDVPAARVKAPGSREVLAVWPAPALRDGVTGRVMLDCAVTTLGAVEGCRITDETPAGVGFGRSALQLAPSFLFRPAMHDGKAVESRIAIPVYFGDQPSRLTPRQAKALQEDVVLTKGLVWAQAPSAADVARAAPPAVRRAGGYVAFQCGVDGDGFLHHCNSTVEAPKGAGLKHAADSLLLPNFRLSLDGVDRGRLKSLHITIPIRFASEAEAKQPRVIERPDWTRRLDPASVQALFPARAADAGLSSGRVVVECRVGARGVLSDCAAVSEDPEGMDFGVNAVRIASALAVNIWSSAGEPTRGATVRFAIRFNKADAAR